MNRDAQILSRIAAAIAVAATAAPLHAGTTSATMSVTATVEESCHIDVRPIHFGAMPSVHPGVDARSSLVLACTPAASYVVMLDNGRNGSGGTRRMADATGTGFLAYDLFTDAAFTRRWGATPSTGVSGIAPTDGRVELGVHARLSGGHTESGSYGDTITVTVAF